MGANALLDFNMAVTLDGDTLSEAEIEALRQSGDGLQFIRGRWVEIDPQAIQRLIKRRALVKRFQDDEQTPFFALSLKAGGASLNLTAASHVIHFDRWWSPAVENQATDRAFRLGQKRNVLVHTFICRGHGGRAH